MVKKLSKESLVLKEALSIPNCINNFVSKDLNNYNEIASLIENKKIKFIVTVARGSSDCAALFGSYIFAKYLGLPTYSMPPSIITLEKSKFNFSDALVIIISQSGLSKDLIFCEESLKKMGARTLVISNNINSPLISSSHYFFHINAGEEKSVAATKTFVMTLLILLKMTLYKSNIKISSFIEKLSEKLLKDENNNWNINSVDTSINTGFILGRGVGFALSNEISLKFKELCQEQIEPFSSAEVMHGPRSLLQNTFKLFTLSINDNSGRTVKKDSDKLKEYTNFCYEISYENDSTFEYKSFELTDLDPIIIMSKFYPWIINYSFKKGLNPDKPRYLTKVTQTY
tara:strand:+ start:52 stop:1080 length:1029 start_codon:yes stop_codon:yes gene_type:complete